MCWSGDYAFLHNAKTCGGKNKKLRRKYVHVFFDSGDKFVTFGILTLRNEYLEESRK